MHLVPILLHSDKSLSLKLIERSLPLLLSWRYDDIGCIADVMNELIAGTCLESRTCRLPAQVGSYIYQSHLNSAQFLSTIASDQTLVELVQFTVQDRPHISSISIRILKDRLTPDSR
jgi:hypothetical protein